MILQCKKGEESNLMKYRLLAAVTAVFLCMTACSSGGDTSSETYSQILSSGVVSSETSSPSSESQSSQAVSSDAESSSSSQAESTASSSGGISGPDGDIPYALAQGERVSDSYFDDAVFIGDSVSLKLEKYVTAKRNSNASFFGGAQFLTAGSMGSGNALQPVSDESIHPLYNGQKMALADSVKASGAKKVYIMLGMNDLAPYGVDGAVSNMQTLIEGILEKTPDAKIFVESATPLVAAQNFPTHKLNNSNIALYNQKMSAVCQEKGWYFVNVWSAVQDGSGNLTASYCSDPDSMGIHFTDSGCEVWLEYLYTHTA